MRNKEEKVIKILVEKLPAKEFWNFIDETQERLENWVKENTADENYECCGFASNVMYRILADWKIHERCGYEHIDDVMRIANLSVRGIKHDVVDIFSFMHDPTHMQFSPSLTRVEYDDGWLDNDDYEACKNIFKSEKILEVCKLIRPELYETKGE